MTNCLFCKIIAEEIPADIVYQDEMLIAFKDIHPKAPTHLLIVPRKHISTLNDLTEQDTLLAGHITQTAAKLAKQLGHAEDGYRVLFNCNKDGGQIIYHLHMHLLAGCDLTERAMP